MADQGDQDREQQPIDMIGHSGAHKAILMGETEILHHKKRFSKKIAYGFGPNLRFAGGAAREEADDDFVH